MTSPEKTTVTLEMTQNEIMALGALFVGWGALNEIATLISVAHGLTTNLVARHEGEAWTSEADADRMAGRLADRLLDGLMAGQQVANGTLPSAEALEGILDDGALAVARKIAELSPGALSDIERFREAGHPEPVIGLILQLGSTAATRGARSGFNSVLSAFGDHVPPTELVAIHNEMMERSQSVAETAFGSVHRPTGEEPS